MNRRAKFDAASFILGEEFLYTRDHPRCMYNDVIKLIIQDHMVIRHLNNAKIK